MTIFKTFIILFSIILAALMIVMVSDAEAKSDAQLQCQKLGGTLVEIPPNLLVCYSQTGETLKVFTKE